MILMNKIRVLFLFILSTTFYQCGIYTYTGANISPDVKTVSIEYFPNEAGDGPANMSQLFTEALRDYFQNNTNPAIDNSGNGDLQFSGAISSFRYSPIAPTASGDDRFADNAGLQRLTITVQAQYMNSMDGTFDFDKSFSFYADYDPNTTSISSIEPALVDEIFEQIVYDIFNASVANW